MLNRQENFLTYFNPLHAKSKETKEEFSKWYEPSKNIQIRAVTLLTGILYIIYSQIDKYIAPASILPVMTLLHLYILPITLFFISALTFSNKYNKMMTLLLLIAPIGAVLGNLFITLNIKEFTIYLPELYLIIIWTFTVSGLRLSHSTISATIMYILILFASSYLFTESKSIFIMHNMWMFSAFSFGLLTAFILEKSSQINFLNSKKLEKLATVDKLTDLYNRFKIENFINEEIQRAERYERVFSIILLDIDKFKSVNDIHGHHAGDVILKEFSKILKGGVRKVDVVGRWGGEEFLIILTETNIDEAKKVAESLRKEIENFKFSVVKDKTSSLGVTEYKTSDTIESIINRADIALYKAKENGRNQVQFC